MGGDTADQTEDHVQSQQKYGFWLKSIIENGFQATCGGRRRICQHQECSLKRQLKNAFKAKLQFDVSIQFSFKDLPIFQKSSIIWIVF